MKKRLIALFSICLLTLSLTACNTASSQKAGNESAPKRQIIIDTDTGADDASALILAAKSPNVDILGVTVLVGNAPMEQAAKNALMSLEIAGCDAPVYKGAGKTTDGVERIAFSVYGDDGMGDAGLIHPAGSPKDGDAVDFILDTIKQHPGEVEIVALGPATNIANAIEKDPETMKNVKMIWSMGTAGLGPGNATPVAEFNAYVDALAYQILLDSGLPVTIIGLDVCDEDALWTNEQFTELEKSGGEIGHFVSTSFGKLKEFYRNNSNESVMNCDGLAMMCVLMPDFVNKDIHVHGSCITDHNQETYGQVLFYQEGITYDVPIEDMNYNVNLITDVNQTDFFKNYLESIKN